MDRFKQLLKALYRAFEEDGRLQASVPRPGFVEDEP